MEADNKLSILESSLKEAVIENSGIEDVESDAFSERFMELFERVREECEASSLQEYKEKAPDILADIREAGAGFEARSFERWKPSFDQSGNDLVDCPRTRRDARKRNSDGKRRRQ